MSTLQGVIETPLGKHGTAPGGSRGPGMQRESVAGDSRAESLPLTA